MQIISQLMKIIKIIPIYKTIFWEKQFQIIIKYL